MVELIGTNERDTLRGTDEADLIYGEGQSDFLEGKGGADIIYGGNGEDWIVGDFGGTYDGGDGFDTLELNARNATTGIFFSNEKPRTYFAGIEALTGVLSNFDDKVVITLATNVRDIPLDASRGVDELVLDYSASSKNVTADWETGQTEAINTITIGGGSFSYRFLDFETITLKLGASDDYMGLYCTSLTVFGNGGNDELSGYYADESQLFGGNGNDSLNGTQVLWC